MKKALSVILAALILASAFSCLGISVFAARSPITYVSINGVVAPVVGETPTYTANNTQNSNQFTISNIQNNGTTIFNGVGWYDATEQKDVKPTDTFKAGHVYSVTIYLCANDSYIFNETVDEMFINGKAASGVIDYDTIDANMQATQFFVYYDFPALEEEQQGGGSSDTVVSRVNIDPESDVKYCELAYNNEITTLSVASIDRSYNSDGFVKGVKWLEDGTKALKKGERFKPDTHYCLQVRLVIADGYEFALNTDVYVWIEREGTYVIGNVINGDTDFIVAELDMDYTEHPSKGLYTSSDGAKFYFTSDGKMYTKRLASISGKKYYFGADGVAYTKRLISVSGKKYYMGADGVAYTKRLISVSGKKYYMGADGVAYTNKLISVSGKKYYMGKDGVAYKSKLISVSGKKYYIGKDCIAYKSKFASLSGKKYYFGSDCVMYKSKTFSVNGVKWVADKNGVCKKK